MSGVETALLAATVEAGSVARRRRWLRRYGLAALGGVVIAIWAFAAILAPWITPYPPDVVNVAGRLLPPSACTGSAPTCWARRVHARDLRRAHLARGRLRRRAAGRPVRHVARRGRRLYARLGGRGADARHRPGVLLSSDHPGDGDRRGARHRHAQHGDRHAGGVVAEIRPPGAQPGDRPALRRIRRRGAGDRLRPFAHPVPPDHAQCGRSAGRAGHARSRQRHPGVRRPVVPRSWRRAADRRNGDRWCPRGANW